MSVVVSYISSGRRVINSLFRSTIGSYIDVGMKKIETAIR